MVQKVPRRLLEKTYMLKLPPDPPLFLLQRLDVYP
jgi:hypothetical protein